MATGRFRYLVAETGAGIIGCITFRDGCHLFNLFMGPPDEGRSVGASLNADPFYRALGLALRASRPANLSPGNRTMGPPQRSPAVSGA